MSVRDRRPERNGLRGWSRLRRFHPASAGRPVPSAVADHDPGVTAEHLVGDAIGSADPPHARDRMLRVRRKMLDVCERLQRTPDAPRVPDECRGVGSGPYGGEPLGPDRAEAAAAKHHADRSRVRRRGQRRPVAACAACDGVRASTLHREGDAQSTRPFPGRPEHRELEPQPAGVRRHGERQHCSHILPGEDDRGWWRCREAVRSARRCGADRRRRSGRGAPGGAPRRDRSGRAMEQHGHDRDSGDAATKSCDAREQPDSHGRARVATPGRGIAATPPADDAGIARAPR